MSLLDSWTAWREPARNRRQARRSARVRAATGFVSQPEPRSLGSVARGRQLMAGNLMFAGFLVQAPGSSPWEVAPPHPEFEAGLHGFGWLDDLAAVGDAAARARAQDWLVGWIARYGQGSGAGWMPDLAGRRLIRWIHHGLFLLAGIQRAQAEAYFRSLAQQTDYLAARCPAATPGLPRFEALTGLLYAGLSLTGMEHHAAPAQSALGRECDARIDAGGGIESRNPEELLEVFTLLVWAAEALRASGQDPAPAHGAAIARIAPTLRTLRHADGSLARFHGGGRGPEGWLDQALGRSGVKAGARSVEAMGYARLAHGRTTVIVDAAPPPGGVASRAAHASTLAFELASGRRPLIVSCGNGRAFGPEWRRAGRATASHSTLSLDGHSSSRLGPAGRARGGAEEHLAQRPGEVTVLREQGAQGAGLLLSHDGHAATHGLIHLRRLDLSGDGRTLLGEDALAALTPEHRRRFQAALDRTGLTGVGYALRFHLHPEVDATLDMGGRAVSLALASGEIWVFRAEGATLTLDPSVYLETGRLRPRPAQQIVLSGLLLEPGVQIAWTLAKAQDTPVAIRDFAFDDPDAVPE